MAAEVPLSIEQGARYTRDFAWYNPLDSNPKLPDLDRPIDLTGWHGRVQFRTSEGTNGTVLWSGNDSDLGGLILGGNTGVVTLDLSAVTTDQFDWIQANYDIKLLPPGITSEEDAVRLVQGYVTIDNRVTA